MFSMPHRRHPLDEPSNCNQQALQRALSELENPMQRDELCRALQRTVQYRLPCGTRVLVTSDPDEPCAQLGVGANHGVEGCGTSQSIRSAEIFI